MQRDSALRRGALGLLLLVSSASTGAVERIPVTAEGGVFEVPVQINEALTLDFVLDTGAAVVMVPIDVALDLEITVDGHRLAGGSAGASPRSDNCWHAYLPTDVLYAIKNGSMLWATLAGRIRYQVDLTGSAKALNTAWAYVEARLPAGR